jgi:hypothetical protein
MSLFEQNQYKVRTLARQDRCRPYKLFMGTMLLKTATHDRYSCFISAKQFVEDKPHSGRHSPSVNAETISKGEGAGACQLADNCQCGSEWSLYTVPISTGGIMTEELNYRWDGSAQSLFHYCWLVIKGSARRQHVLWKQWQRNNAIWRHWLADDLTRNIRGYSSLQIIPRTTQLQTIPQTTAAEYYVALFAGTYKCQAYIDE